MSDLSIAPRARLFTLFGTVLYVHVASGEIRHGAIDTSPANAMFAADPSSAGPHRRGWLMYDAGSSRELIVCLADCCHSVSRSEGGGGSASPTVLDLIPLERGLIAFKAGDFFLSAPPDGRIRLSGPECSTSELFLASEAWCTDVPATADERLWDTAGAKFDKKRIESCIVHPRIRVKAKAKPKAKTVLIYGYTKWSHGRVYYDLCKHLHRRGYIVDILDWRVNHAAYIGEIIPYYDLFITALDGVGTLVDKYSVPYDRIIAISHHELDIRMLIEQKGFEVFEKFANYGVVSEFIYCASQMRGVPRVPMVASLGINFLEFYSKIPERLETVGYASSMSVKNYGVEWKRGELAEAAAREAGLAFKVAGSTGNQMSFHDMPDFYRTVDAVLTSSISEAAQLPVMEAAAAGRLVIGTPVGHFPRRAYQGGGILAPVEAERFKAFTAAMLRYYKENPAAFTDMCHSIQEAARNFDWQYTIDEWVALIECAPMRFVSENPARHHTLQISNLANSGKQTSKTVRLAASSALKQLDVVSEIRAVKSAGLSRPGALCSLMTSFGSDKGAPFHNYTVVYDRLFAQCRSKSLTVFELGLGTNKVGAASSMGAHGRPGASLRGWRAYFPSAQIFGADIDADILFEEDRISTFWVDQRDPEAIRALWDRIGDVTFDIMIDDGLHEAAANICFFMESISKLKSGGIYVIEDVRPQDIDAMKSFVACVACISKGIIFEALEHPLNNVDNRLVIFQKA
jgi:hypothetical protein